jgi:hypothetical protein
MLKSPLCKIRHKIPARKLHDEMKKVVDSIPEHDMSV